jgi:hypothetical protein
MNIEITTVASMARNNKAMKKDEGVANVIALTEAINSSDPIAAEKALSNLYSFFSGATKKMAKYTPEKWVAIAMANKDIRQFSNYVYSDGSNLIATDGYRMHVVPCTNYPKGYYDRNMISVSMDDVYPNWGSVIMNTIKEGVVFYEHVELAKTPVVNVAPMVDAYDLPDGVRVNCKYVDEAIQMFEDKGHIKYYVEFNKSNKPVKIMFVGDDGQRAVIMVIQK